jgi:hypothetical protein
MVHQYQLTDENATVCTQILSLGTNGSPVLAE